MNQIVIVGAGIAGLTLATALRQRNIEVLVLERRTDLSSQGGAYLTISGQAIDQLISIGVSEELRHVGVASRKSFERDQESHPAHHCPSRIRH